MTTLQALRIFGPITLESFAAKLGQPAVSVDWQLWSLETLGLAAHPTRSNGEWACTEAGRAYVDHHEVAEVTAVRRDEARACVGVRNG